MFLVSFLSFFEDKRTEPVWWFWWSCRPGQSLQCIQVPVPPTLLSYQVSLEKLREMSNNVNVKHQQTSCEFCFHPFVSFCCNAQHGVHNENSMCEHYMQTYANIMCKHVEKLYYEILWVFMQMYGNHTCCNQEKEAPATAITISST